MKDSDDPSDELLVGRAQAGDREALEALIRRHQQSAYRLCLRYVRDHDEAADLVQRTFVRAMTALPVLRAAESFRSWVLRIAANLALNHVRDDAKFVRGDDPAGEHPRAAGRGAAPPDAGAGLEADEDARALRRAVAALPPKQRLTLELRVHDELSFRDIAETLGTTEGAAKVNFHYAVRSLRQRMTGTAGETAQRKRRGS